MEKRRGADVLCCDLRLKEMMEDLIRFRRVTETSHVGPLSAADSSQGRHVTMHNVSVSLFFMCDLIFKPTWVKLRWWDGVINVIFVDE